MSILGIPKRTLTKERRRIDEYLVLFEYRMSGFIYTKLVSFFY